MLLARPAHERPMSVCCVLSITSPGEHLCPCDGANAPLMLLIACCAGNITVPAAVDTNFTFSMDSDDGAQLYIDGKLLIDKGGAPRCWLV